MLLQKSEASDMRGVFMRCPHCSRDIKESLILSWAASILGKRSRRKITRKQQVIMQKARLNKKRDVSS